MSEASRSEASRSDEALAADVAYTPAYRGRVRLRARTIAGTEALESLQGREHDGVLFLSRCGTKATVCASMFDRFLSDLIHDHGIDMAEEAPHCGVAPALTPFGSLSWV